MAIGNVTPDSFYSGSRIWDGSVLSDSFRSKVSEWAERSLSDGADILDIGGCSTRPGSTPVEEEEEWRRLAPAIEAVRAVCPQAVLSIDTFRPTIARRALEQYGPLIINDISGGCAEMCALVRAHRATYIWTLCGNMQLPAEHPEMADIDLILDPGFGFIGSTEADYACMRQLDLLRAYHLPVLVGVSRKSMVYKPLGLRPESCLAATQALQLYALEHGATILRTHDVAETAQIRRLFEALEGKEV